VFHHLSFLLRLLHGVGLQPEERRGLSLRAEIEARSNYREAERRVSTLLLSKLEKPNGEKLARWQASPIVIDRELRLKKRINIGIANCEKVAETSDARDYVLCFIKL
jgi:hypothetical protein